MFDIQSHRPTKYLTTIFHNLSYFKHLKHNSLHYTKLSNINHVKNSLHQIPITLGSAWLTYNIGHFVSDYPSSSDDNIVTLVISHSETVQYWWTQNTTSHGQSTHSQSYAWLAKWALTHGWKLGCFLSISAIPSSILTAW